jgi:formate dehydrogenase major subunit
MQVTRRQFVKYAAGGLGASTVAALGFSPRPVLAEVRQFKLAHATETRNTCPYCAVGCGIVMYSLGDRSKNAHSEIIHIEGDPDHPVNRGTLCPKGASLLDFVKSPNRLKFPEYRGAGASRAS